MEASDALYNAILARERTFDGILYIGIRTTGIVCFPSCRSRTPKRENVEVFTSLDEALRRGYRACKRCRPDDAGHLAPDAALATQVETMMRACFPEKVPVDVLAQSLHVSPRHLSRTVRRVKGLSLSELWTRIWLAEAQQWLLLPSLSIGDVAEKLGMRDPAYFSRRFFKHAGMTPSGFRISRRKV